MRILLVGAQGQVGQELQTTLPAVGQLTPWTRTQLDLSQSDEIAPKIIAQQPDIIVNAAAYTAVDRAETERDLAFAINGKAPAELAKAANDCGAILVHISTDYVFDGRQNRPYRPEDTTNPLGAYGHSKRAGEIAIADRCDRHAIVRTAWVYGAKGKGNFVKTMLRLGGDRETLNVVYDQVGSPTWAYDIAAAITALIPTLTPSTFGTYHFTNSGAVSWYDFAVAIFEEAVALGHPLTLKHVIPITTDKYPTPAQRPPYSVMGGEKLAGLIGQTAPHWRESMRKMLREYLFTQ